jgi:hypothetical protein
MNVIIDFEMFECKPEEIKGLPVCGKPSEKDLEVWKKGER